MPILFYPDHFLPDLSPTSRFLPIRSLLVRIVCTDSFLLVSLVRIISTDLVVTIVSTDPIRHKHRFYGPLWPPILFQRSFCTDPTRHSHRLDWSRCIRIICYRYFSNGRFLPIRALVRIVFIDCFVPLSFLIFFSPCLFNDGFYRPDPSSTVSNDSFVPIPFFEFFFFQRSFLPIRSLASSVFTDRPFYVHE